MDIMLIEVRGRARWQQYGSSRIHQPDLRLPSIGHKLGPPPDLLAIAGDVACFLLWIYEHTSELEPCLATAGNRLGHLDHVHR